MLLWYDGLAGMKEPGKLMLAGDFHGNTQWAKSVITYASYQGCDTILQLGDFGFWVEGTSTHYYLSEVNSTLGDLGIRLYWIDGNHEDHARIDKLRQGVRTPWNHAAYPNIWHLPRGFRWEWWGQTWMSVGGAVSPDRHMRSPGKSWWPQEQLSDSDMDYCRRPGKVDVIVSHDCPSGVDIPGLSPPGTWPESALYDSYQHRLKLRQIWDEKGVTRLYHGHYHSRYDAPLGNGLVTGLDMDATTMKDNTLVLC